MTTGSAHSRARDFQRGQAESAGRKQSRNPKTANYKVAVITKQKGECRWRSTARLNFYSRGRWTRL